MVGKKIAADGSATSRTCKTPFNFNWWVSRLWVLTTEKKGTIRDTFLLLFFLVPPLALALLL